MPISMVPAFQCKNDMHVANFSQCQAKLLQDFVRFNMNTSFAVSVCLHQHYSCYYCQDFYTLDILFINASTFSSRSYIMYLLAYCYYFVSWGQL